MAHDARAPDTRAQCMQKMKASIARCWRPSPENRSVYTDPAVHLDMVAALQEELSKSQSHDTVPLYPKSATGEIAAFGFAKGVMPKHFVGLINI